MAERISLENVVKEFAGSTLKKELNKYAEAGKKAAREIREGIVNMWFGEFNSSSVNAATKYVPYTKVFDNFSVQIVINSYVDLDAYADKPEAERWRTKYGGEWDSKYYVLVHLQMTEGIIGLPEKSKAYPDHGWENEHFVQRPAGLRYEIFNEANWSKWDALVDKYAK